MQFVKGMDVSMFGALNERGAVYRIDGREDDLFSILKKCGTDMVRLRIWVDPYDDEGRPYGGGMNDLQMTIKLAERVIENGMSYMLDFHYSDFWADPSKQTKPKAWRKLEGESLETAVYLHTAETLKCLKNRNLLPEMVQIGNEITNGLLWPDGHVNNTESMVKLLKAGIEGTREICQNAKIVLHLDYGTDNKMYRRWFDAIVPYNPDFDIIGMSFYPHVNGDINMLVSNMNDISARYNKDVIIAETSIGYTVDTFGCTGAVYTDAVERAMGYPATQEGQEIFLRELCAAVKSVYNGRGTGVFYWEPAWLPIPGCEWANSEGSIYMKDIMEPGNAMANQALFDENGNANRALLNLKMM